MVQLLVGARFHALGARFVYSECQMSKDRCTVYQPHVPDMMIVEGGGDDGDAHGGDDDDDEASGIIIYKMT